MFFFFTGIIGVIELHVSHTANYNSLEIIKCLSEWHIPKQKIMTVVSDNWANIKHQNYFKSCQFLKIKYYGRFVVQCLMLS